MLQLTDLESPRGRLLNAAARLFREKGYGRTTVRDIAADVGILSGSIFHHFKNKDEILCAVMEECVEALLIRQQEMLMQADSSVERLRALVYCELQSICGDGGNALTVLVFEWGSLSDESQKKLLHRREKYESIWMHELDQAAPYLKSGIDLFVLRRYLSGALYWTSSWYREEGAYNIDEMTDMALAMILK